jgi:hypothetical protein
MGDEEQCVGGILGYQEIPHTALFLVVEQHSDEPLRDSSQKVLDREDLLQEGVVCITPKG